MISFILTVGEWILTAYAGIWLVLGTVLTLGMIFSKKTSWDVDDVKLVLKIHLTTALVLIAIKILSLDFPLS